jgi:hypothetical protein
MQDRPPRGSDAELKRIADAVQGWEKSLKLDPQMVSQKLQATLLERLLMKAKSLITSEVLTQIHGSEDIDHRRKMLQNICDELSEFVYADLIALTGRLRALRPYSTPDPERPVSKAVYF